MPIPMTASTPAEDEAMKAKLEERRNLIHTWALEQADDIETALEAIKDRSIEARQAVAFHAATPKFYYLEGARKRSAVRQAIAKSKVNGETGAGAGRQAEPGVGEVTRAPNTEVVASSPAPAPKPEPERAAVNINVGTPGLPSKSQEHFGNDGLTTGTIPAPQSPPKEPARSIPKVGEQRTEPLVRKTWERIHFAPFAERNMGRAIAEVFKEFDDRSFLLPAALRQDVPQFAPEAYMAIVDALPEKEWQALLEICLSASERGEAPKRKGRRY
jgi:hypothetical protein